MDTDIKAEVITYPDGRRVLRVTDRGYREWMKKRVAETQQDVRTVNVMQTNPAAFAGLLDDLKKDPAASLRDRVRGFIKNF